MWHLFSMLKNACWAPGLANLRFLPSSTISKLLATESPGLLFLSSLLPFKSQTISIFFSLLNTLFIIWNAIVCWFYEAWWLCTCRRSVLRMCRISQSKDVGQCFVHVSAVVTIEEQLSTRSPEYDSLTHVSYPMARRLIERVCRIPWASPHVPMQQPEYLLRCVAYLISDARPSM